MKRFLLIASALLLCTGCSATWKGMKEDTSKNATAVKAKTE